MGIEVQLVPYLSYPHLSVSNIFLPELISVYQINNHSL